MTRNPLPHGQPQVIPIKRTFAIIGAIVIAEPFAATILFPFVYFMIHDFGTVQEKDITFRAGLLTSAFFVPQMLTAAVLGMVSDRLGRKPVLILGLLGSALCVFAFGFSKSLLWAVFSRSLCGLFNGNAGVSRTAIGELAHNTGLNQGRVFSLFGFCTAISYVVGPLVGGFLARPTEKFSSFHHAKLFVEYPYLLPCALSALYNVLVAAISWPFLHETNENIHKSSSKATAAADETQPEDATAREPLLKGTPPVAIADVVPRNAAWYCIFGVGCISFHAIIFDEIYPIFAASARHHGLQFTSSNIAASLSIMGPVICVAQLVLYPMLHNRFSPLALWRASAAIFMVVYPLFSLLPHISRSDHGPSRVLQWVGVIFLLTIRFIANVVAYTSISVLMNQVVAPEKRGAMMGLGQTAISLGRAFGPALGGTIWSWSLGNGLSAPLDFHALFLFELALAITQGLSSVGLS